MSYLLFGFRLLFLFCTFLGYIFFYYDKTRLNPAFLPIIVISSITICTYLAGLLNILNLAVTVISLLGLLLMVYYIVRIIQKKFSLTPFLSPGIVLFLIASVYLVFLLRGASVLHYDDFSHWSLIVKEMFLAQAYPTEASVVTFRNYPPGTATFIYYVCQIIGYKESYTLMAQGFLAAGCISAIFYKAEWKKWITLLSLFALSLAMISFIALDSQALMIYSLLVDSILGYLTIAAFLIVYAYRKQVKQCFLAVLPVLSMLVLTKDSGKVFFFEILLVMLVLWFLQDHRWIIKPQKLLRFAGLIGIPLFLGHLWNMYIVKAYPSVALEENKFRFTAEKITEIFEAHSPGFLQELPLQLLTKAFDLRTLSGKFLLLTLIVVLAAILWLLLHKRKIKAVLWTVILSFTLLVVYLVNLYVLYAFLMPVAEAEWLASFDRYYSSAVVISFALPLIAVIYTVSETEIRLQKLAKLVLLLAVSSLLCFSPANTKQLIKRPNYGVQKRTLLQPAREKLFRQAGRDKTILMYIGNIDKSSMFYYYLTSYDMLTSTRKIGIIDKADLDAGNQFSYFVYYEYLITQPDPSFLQYLTSLGMQFDNGTDGEIYRIRNENGKVILSCIG